MTKTTINLSQVSAFKMPLADESVHCIITSPPYWGLRDYGLGVWEGGNSDCDHIEAKYNLGLGLASFSEKYYRGGGHKQANIGTRQFFGQCAKCGAIQVSDGIGIEPLHDCLGWTRNENCGFCYVCRIRQVARECWRVLRSDGTFWLNLGDSYAGSGKGRMANGKHSTSGAKQQTNKGTIVGKLCKTKNMDQLKPKDLVGIPWRVALALQADGWYLRSDIIWAKPNPMPESVTDRPTKSHEYVFLLTKSKKYFFDQQNVRNHVAQGKHGKGIFSDGSKAEYIEKYYMNGSNIRTVWNIPTKPYKGAHFATFPEKLVEPMIKAGTSEYGCCPECGKQWVRVTEKGDFVSMRWKPGVDKTMKAKGKHGNSSAMLTGGVNERITIDWKPTCNHGHNPVPCLVVDPFTGSSTTGVVAMKLRRSFVGFDLSADYLKLSRQRLGLDKLDAWKLGKVEKKDKTDEGDNSIYDDLPIFNVETNVEAYS